MDTFLVGTFAEPTASEYRDLVSSPPLYVSPSPVIFLAEPGPKFPTPPTEPIRMRVQTHHIRYNPNTDRAEMVALLIPSGDVSLAKYGIDIHSFRPYFRIASDPMLSKLTRFWTNSIGNAMNDQEVLINVHVSSDERLNQEFNPEASER